MQGKNGFTSGNGYRRCHASVRERFVGMDEVGAAEADHVGLGCHCDVVEVCVGWRWWKIESVRVRVDQATSISTDTSRREEAIRGSCP